MCTDKTSEFSRQVEYFATHKWWIVTNQVSFDEFWTHFQKIEFWMALNRDFLSILCDNCIKWIEYVGKYWNLGLTRFCLTHYTLSLSSFAAVISRYHYRLQYRIIWHVEKVFQFIIGFEIIVKCKLNRSIFCLKDQKYYGNLSMQKGIPPIDRSIGWSSFK